MQRSSLNESSPFYWEGPDGRRVIDQEWVQLHLARVHAKVQFLRLKNWQVASGGAVSPADASATDTTVCAPRKRTATNSKPKPASR